MRASRRANGPVLTARFLFVPDHSAFVPRRCGSTNRRPHFLAPIAWHLLSCAQAIWANAITASSYRPTQFVPSVASIVTPSVIFSVARSHYERKQPRMQTEVLGYLVVHSLIRSHCSLVRLLQTAQFARTLHCAHLFACSLTSLNPWLVGK